MEGEAVVTGRVVLVVAVVVTGRFVRAVGGGAEAAALACAVEVTGLDAVAVPAGAGGAGDEPCDRLPIGSVVGLYAES